jgi:hypothetical protein
MQVEFLRKRLATSLGGVSIIYLQNNGEEIGMNGKKRILVVLVVLVIVVLALSAAPALGVKAPPGLHKMPAAGNVNPHVVCIRCHTVPTVAPCAACHAPG